jgi:hypothetical protein
VAFSPEDNILMPKLSKLEKKALREAKKEERQKVPSAKGLEQEDQKFIEQARELKKVLTPDPWYLKKKKK